MTPIKRKQLENPVTWTSVTGAASVAFGQYTGVIVDATAGSFTLTIDPPLNRERTLLVKRLDNAFANTVTIVYSGGSIEGFPSITLGSVTGPPNGGRRTNCVELVFVDATPTKIITT